MTAGPDAGRHLWVLRHAKAAADGPDDHGRPLTGRGARQAADLARRIADGPGPGGPLPTTVLCSSARRALQTAELVAPVLGERVELVVERALYQADPDDVVARLGELPDTTPAVMVVGHNPTLHDLVGLLLAPADEAGRAGLDEGFAPATLAVVALPPGRWSVSPLGTGTLSALWRPGG